MSVGKDCIFLSKARALLTKAKEKVSIAVSDDLLKWIDSQIKKRRFASRSHAFEYAVKLMMEKEE